MDITHIPMSLSLDLPDRTPGLHVTDLTKALMHTIDPKRFGYDDLNWDDPEALAKIHMGWAWEEFLGRALSQVNADVTTVGEVEHDGVTGTPDGLDVPPWIIEEYKATWASSNKDLDHPFFTHWHLQAMAYCYMMEATMVRFRVIHINGDWSRPFDFMTPGFSRTEWKCVEMEFSDIELEENWYSLLQFRDRVAR